MLDVTETNIEITFEDAVNLVGRAPDSQERNDLVVDYGMVKPLWRWSRDNDVTLEQATVVHEKLGRKFMTVPRSSEERPGTESEVMTDKPTPRAKQRSRKRKPRPAAVPDLTRAETKSAPNSQSPGNSALPEVTAAAGPPPRQVSSVSEYLATNSPVNQSAAAEVISPIPGVPVSPAAPPDSSPNHSSNKAVATPSGNPSKPTQESQTSSRRGKVMPSSTSVKRKKLPGAATLGETASPLPASEPPRPVKGDWSPRRLYPIVVWFVASSGVFAYFLGRITASGVAWIAGYWMVTLAVALVIWAAESLISSPAEKRSGLTKQ